MEELIKEINNLSQISWLDICAVVAPIILSVVAIIISIATARKQNKITLFEKRYEIYCELCKIKRIYFFIKESTSAKNNPENLLMDLRLLISEEYPELEELKTVVDVQKIRIVNDSVDCIKLRSYIQKFPELRAKCTIFFKVDINSCMYSFSQMIFDLYHTSGFVHDTITYITSYETFMKEFDVFLMSKFKQIEKQVKL